MNAETIYTMTREAMDAYITMHKDTELAIPNNYAEYIPFFEQMGMHKPFVALYTLNKEASEEIYRKSAKGSSRPSLSAVKRLLKNTPAYNETLKKAWWAEGKWWLCDSYRAVGLNEAVPTIPTYDPDHDKYVPVNMVQIAKPLFDGTYMEEVELPSVAEVKQAILDAKAKGEKDKPKIMVGVRWFNAKYLQDIMEILPKAKMYQTNDNPTSMVFFKDDEGNIGLLCAVRP